MEDSDTAVPPHHVVNFDATAKNDRGQQANVANGGSVGTQPNGRTRANGTNRGGEPMVKFRSEARIWQLYLEEAEREAKERVELWKTGLDSLLIFAGLFAGIVSSFLIDARHDLQKDSEQNLLTDIRDILRRRSISDIANIPVSQKWINGLWLLSLYITLFGAIMGVLAKAWLAKFLPATTRREATDAYARYKLDKEAKWWHLEAVITLVPFLVQVAAFLFLAGLIVQSRTDDRTLGYMLLGVCVSGCAIYIVMTSLPFFFPSSPFNTPLSAILPGLGRTLRLLVFNLLPSVGGVLKAIFTCSRPESPDINSELAEILHTKLIRSPKPTHVDAAATEIALPTFDADMIRYFCQNDTPSHLLARFKTCALTRTNNVEEQNEALCSHLLAFLQLIDHIDDSLVSGAGDQYECLLDALRTLLELDSPLHRWNTLHESLRPLSFGLRTQILALLKPVPDEYWDNKGSIPLTLDFHYTEMSDYPWELALQDVPSTQRLHFVLAACRGVLARGQKNVKTTCVLTLGMCLAKAGCTTSDKGRTSEWNIEKQERDEVESLSRNFLSQLHKTTRRELEGMAVVALNDMSSISPDFKFELGAVHPRQNVLDALFSESTLPHRASRFHTIQVLNQALNLNPDIFNPGPIEFISNMIVYEDEDATEGGLSLLSKLAQSSEQKMGTVTNALFASIARGFTLESQQSLRTITFVRTLGSDSDSPFYPHITQAIPGLVEIALNRDATDIRRLALRLVRDLRARGFKEVTSVMQETLTEVQNRKYIVTDLSKLLEDDESDGATQNVPSFTLCIGTFRAVFEEIVKCFVLDLGDEAPETLLEILRKDTGGLVRSFLTDGALAWLETAAARPSWQWWIRERTVLVLETFIDHLDHTNENLIRKLVQWAGADEDDDVRRSSVRLVWTICKTNISPATLKAVTSAILSLKNSVIEEPFSSIRSIWIDALGDMVKNALLPELVPIFLKLCVKADSHSKVWHNAHEDLLIRFLMPEKWGNDPEYIKALENAFPHLTISSYGSWSEWPATAKWIKLLVALSRKPSLERSAEKVLRAIAKDVRDGIDGKPLLTPLESHSNTQESEDDPEAIEFMSQSTLGLPLRRLLHDAKWVNRMTWADILASIAAYLPHEFPDAHTILFQIARHDSDTDVQSACLQSLILLAKQCTAITGELLSSDTISHFDDFIDSTDSGVRFSYLQLLSAVRPLKKGELSDKIFEKLSNMALSDPDDELRFEAVNIFLQLNLLETKDRDRDPVSGVGDCEKVKKIVRDRFNEGIADGSWKLRQSWIKLVGTQIKDAEPPGLTELFDAAIKDVHRDVQAEAMKIFQGLLDDAKLKASLASKLAKPLALSLAEAKFADRAMTVLKMITTPFNERDPQPDLGPSSPDGTQREGVKVRHELWIQIIRLLSRNTEFGRALPNSIIEVVIKEKTKDYYFKSLEALHSLFQNSKLPDAIESALSFGGPPDTRSIAIDLVGRLTGCVPGLGQKPQPMYEGLLPREQTSDSLIISRLADIVVKCDDDNLRIATLRVLELAYDKKAADVFRFQDAIKQSLSKVLWNALKEQESLKIRANAISAVNSLTKGDINNYFIGIVSPCVPQLLRIWLVEGDQNLGDSVERLLFQNFTVSTPEISKLCCDVFVAIPPMATTISLPGKAIVLRLAETLPISDDYAATIAHAMALMLQDSSSFVRAIAIEVFLKLSRRSKPRFFESALPGIIALALNDNKSSDGDIRITAIQSLVALSSEPANPSQASCSVLRRVKDRAVDFMALLQNEQLRPYVAELLSLMSLDDTFRQSIMLRIASVACSSSESPYLVSHVELLTRLISDGRMGKTAADVMMLFLAPALVTRPQLAPFRLKILIAVWCQYERGSLVDDITPGNMGDKELEKLLEWFTLAVFGRHVTEHEATTWRRRFGRYFPQPDRDREPPA